MNNFELCYPQLAVTRTRIVKVYAKSSRDRSRLYVAAVTVDVE